MKPIIIIYLFFLSHCAISQKNIKPLTIGDTVPNIKIENIINYKNDKGNVTDFRTKLLILDFWATWCSPCVAAFPKLDSLQKKFGDKIIILPVTKENKEIVKDFLLKMQKVKHVLPPTVTDDTVLSKLFNFTYLPHYVWVDNNNVVIAITDRFEVTENNIQMVLSGGKINFPLKNDQEKKIVREDRKTVLTPSIQIRNGDNIELKKISENDLILHSTLTKFLTGSPIIVHVDSSLVYVWGNILLLYRVALWRNKNETLSPSKTIAEIDDSLLYETITGEYKSNGKSIARGALTEQWLKINGYSYELKVPGELGNQKFDIMLDELNRYFGVLYGIEGVMEMRNQKYLELIRTSNIDKISSKGTVESLKQDKFSLIIKHKNIKVLSQSLSKSFQFYSSIVNKIQYDGMIDLELNCDMADLISVNRELAKYDLQLIEKEALMEVAVVRMKGGAKNTSRETN